MKKGIVIICGLCALMGAVMPNQASAAQSMAEVSAINSDIDISVSGSVLTVNNAKGLTLQVVSLTGKVINSIRIDNPSQRIELNVPTGCYILKVGNVVRKVAIKK